MWNRGYYTMAKRDEVLLAWQEIVSRLKVANEWDIVLVVRTESSYLDRTCL